MIEDERTYGFTGERSRWIRWEFAALVAFGLTQVAYSANLLLHYGPSRYDIQLYDVWPSLGLIIFLCWVAWMSGDSFEMFGFMKPALKDLAWFAVTLLISVILLLGPFAILANGMPQDWIGPRFNLSAFQVDRFLLAIPLYLLLAAYEEIYYRGLLQARAQEIVSSRWAAIGGSAALFTLTHLYQGFQALPWILAFGLAYAAIRSRGCPLWPLVLAHATSNAVWSGFQVIQERI